MNNYRYVSILILVTNLLFSANSFAGIIDNLVAYYPFNGNANDAGHNAFNGTVIGATLTTDRMGNSNSAYFFDGVDDAISLNNHSLLTGASALTLSAWINPNTISLSYQEIMVNGTNDFLLRLDSGGKIVACVNNSDCLATGQGVINTNEWFNVLYTWNGTNTGTQSIYIDGIEITSGTANQTSVRDSGDAWIGSFVAGTSWGREYFNGILDDIRVYDRVLSYEEIQEIANNSTSQPISAPPILALIVFGLLGLGIKRRK